MKAKKFVEVLLVGSMVVSLLTGCQSTTSSSDSKDTVQTGTVADGTEQSSTGDQTAALLENGRYAQVNVALGVDPADLLPCKPNGNGKPMFFWDIYETLFDYDDDNNLVGNLATGYEVVSDTEWDVSIYSTIYDSEGNHITADDVVYSVQWLVDSGNAIKYGVFDSIEKIDDYTVRYHWTQAPSTADLEFIFVRTFVFSQKAFESHNFSVEPIGTGPYVVSSFASGSKLVLEATDDYWADHTEEDVSGRLGYHTATVQTINFEVLPEASSAVVALEMGSVDFCDYVPYAQLGEFSEGGQYADKYNVESSMGSDYYYIMPNMSTSVVGQNLDLRLAIYYALDNETISTAMGGNYVALKSLGTTYFNDFNSDWESEETYINTCNTDLAKEYLDKSGYNNEEILIVGLSNEECKNALTLVQAQLLQVGINAKIETYEEAYMSSVLGERTGWDFFLTKVGGSTLVASWNTLFNGDVHDGYTTNWLQDETLQDLYETSLQDATHDDEHVKACIDYALSIGDVYPVAGTASSKVSAKAITSIYYREGYVTLGASTYAGQ